MKDQWPRVFAARHRDDALRAQSQSGGAFVALSDAILNAGGVVYGCVLDDAMRAVHVRAETAAERDRMCGSKYVQSDLEGVFDAIRQDLGDGRRVLFTGTPCQVDAVRQVFGHAYDGLYLADIVCFGVNSPEIWEKNVEWIERRYKGKVVSALFRNKRYGWASNRETYHIRRENGAGRTVDSLVYRRLYSQRVALRPSCHVCPYKSLIRPGDITLGDYWGIDRVLPDFNDGKGISLILVNSPKGEALLAQTGEALALRETEREDCLQPALVAPFPIPLNRAAFWRDYAAGGYDRVARRYGGYGARRALRRFAGKCKTRLKRMLKP